MINDKIFEIESHLLLAIHILSASQTFDFSSDLPDPLSQMSVSSDCQCAEKVSCNEVRHSFHASGKTHYYMASSVSGQDERNRAL